MRVIRLFGVCSVFGLVATMYACGGADRGDNGVRLPPDLAGFVSSSQSGAPDAATGTGSDTGNCGAVTAAGACVGDTLSYCDESNHLATLDCSTQGLTCSSAGGQADCVGSGTGTGTGTGTGSGCGAITSDGTCTGNTLEYCDGGTVQTQDCAAQGDVCQVSSAGYADCAAGTTGGGGGGSCGTTTYAGFCTGTTVTWCENNQLQTYNCNDGTSTKCAVDQSGNADCE